MTRPWRVLIDFDGTMTEKDADFALVVSGALLSSCSAQGRIDVGTPKCACEGQVTISVVDCDLNTDNEAVETVTGRPCCSRRPVRIRLIFEGR